MASPPDSSLPPILPLGTAVVTRVEVKSKTGRPAHPCGAAGVIVQLPADPEHSYRIRFPSGDDASLKRGDLHVLSHFQDPAFGRSVDPLIEYDLYQHVIYRCVIGSRAYGLEGDDSDTDRRGIYLPPAENQWSIYGIPEQLENLETEECYWELEKCLKLALKANPNVLEVLYSPIVEHATPLAQEMLDLRGRFLSKLVYQTFNGYAMSQFKKIEQDVRNHGEVKWKHAMHLVRLLLSGIVALRDGYVPVKVEDEFRVRLLTIRHGQMPWEHVDAWRLELHRQFEGAFAATNLPERPDYEAANAFLVRARRSMVSGL